MQHSIDFAIASACPLSSAPTPGYAPGVSIKEIIGILKLNGKEEDKNDWFYKDFG